MEEFKNLKEIIELCKEELENNDENTHATLDLVDLKELENLINKYKEQKRDIQASHILLAKYSQKNEEQEKITELMAFDIAKSDFDEDICRQMKKDEFWCGSTDEECKNCVIEYYEKKARE